MELNIRVCLRELKNWIVPTSSSSNPSSCHSRPFVVFQTKGKLSRWLRPSVRRFAGKWEGIAWLIFSHYICTFYGKLPTRYFKKIFRQVISRVCVHYKEEEYHLEENYKKAGYSLLLCLRQLILHFLHVLNRHSFEETRIYWTSGRRSSGAI